MGRKKKVKVVPEGLFKCSNCGAVKPNSEIGFINKNEKYCKACETWTISILKGEINA